MTRKRHENDPDLPDQETEVSVEKSEAEEPVRKAIGEQGEAAVRGTEKIAEPEPPPGADTAIWHDGWISGREVARDELIIKTNPFAEGTYQRDNWQQAYDLAVAAGVDPPPEGGGGETPEATERVARVRAEREQSLLESAKERAGPSRARERQYAAQLDQIDSPERRSSE